MRTALYSTAIAILISGCGYKGPLYLPKPKPVAQKPDAPASVPAPVSPAPAAPAASPQPQDDATKQ
jgi:predicted small lipoprotein YifL